MLALLGFGVLLLLNEASLLLVLLIFNSFQLLLLGVEYVFGLESLGTRPEGVEGVVVEREEVLGF